MEVGVMQIDLIMEVYQMLAHEGFLTDPLEDSSEETGIRTVVKDTLLGRRRLSDYTRVQYLTHSLKVLRYLIV